MKKTYITQLLLPPSLERRERPERGELHSKLHFGMENTSRYVTPRRFL